MNAKIGDYFISYNKQLYRIVDVYMDKISSDELCDIRGTSGPENCRCINIKYLKTLGKIIPQENLTDMMDVLYGESKNYSWGFGNTK
jgi:hypothetical protein